MVHKNPAHALEHPSIKRPPTRISVGQLLALGTALWLGACANSPCPEGLTHAGGQCVSTDDTPDAAAQETGGANAHVDAETPDAAPMPSDADMPDGSSTDGTDADMPDGSSTDGTDAAMPDGTVPEMMDATPPDPCLAAACADNSECVVEDDTAHCNCLRGYIKGALGCERDECQALTEEDGPTCGANASCEDPTAEPEDFECNCNERFASCDGEEDPEPGCETNLRDNPDHCGACGYACAGNLSCIEGKCEQAADRLVLSLANTCILSNASDSSYEMACAGTNQYNKLNRGEDNTKSYPRFEPIPGIDGTPRVRQMGMGRAHSCTIPPDGNRVRCWGDNGFKQLGDGVIDLAPNTVTNLRLPGVIELALGAIHSCALTGDGRVHCWGYAADLRLGQDFNTDLSAGDEPITSVAEVVTVPNLGQVAHIAAGVASTCALGRSGAISCWGALHDLLTVSNEAGYLPTPVTDTNGQPLNSTQISGGGPMLSAATLQISNHCALLKSRRVACWGTPSFGMIGGDNTVAMNASIATDIGLTDVVDIGVGGWGACAVNTAGEVLCWGAKDFVDVYAAPCDSSTPPGEPCHERIRPTLVSISDAIDVEVGQSHACARRGNGEVVCWGNNQRGQLGIGSIATDGAPLPPRPVPSYP